MLAKRLMFNGSSDFWICLGEGAGHAVSHTWILRQTKGDEAVEKEEKTNLPGKQE